MKFLKKLRNILLCLLAGAACGIGAFAYFRPYKTVETSGTGAITEVTEISGQTIRSSLAEIGELCTAEYDYQHVENYSDSKKVFKFNVPLTEKSFIYSYCGTITAGCDFADIDVEVDESSREVIVTLPEMKILHNEIDMNSYEKYDETNSIFNPISIDDVQKTNEDMEQTEAENAINKGLLDNAQANAKLLIENIVKASVAGTDYNVVVKTADES